MMWETVIGIEVHTQLATRSKIFSGAATRYGAEPNTQACIVDLAMPGALPVLNKSVVEMAIKFGLAVDAVVNQTSVFSRKNYFYPDLPKGYQISQFDLPIVSGGYLDIQLKQGQTKRIGITRAHLEEDAGKSLHEDFNGMSAIDLNRAGTPLLEIVSEPDMRSAEEVVAYLKTLHSLLRYLQISDGNMQEGSFRCDVNVSVRQFGASLGTRSELKNLNSFKFVEKAIEYEVSRQIALIEQGGVVVQETRLYDSVKNETRSLRSKENAHDYRYFPDPDLLPLVIESAMLEGVKGTLPELPKAKAARFEQEYGLSVYDAHVLVAQRENAAYFESVVLQVKDAKLTANWVMGDLAAFLNKDNLDISESPVSADALSGLLIRIVDGTISGRMAKEVFEAIWQKEGTADQVIESRGLKQISDTGALLATVKEVILANPGQLAEYRSGKDRLF
ncbi:MAG: Asp-tRNA(Asn)/Glu-tRNA(Gln) amidotransferase subunit GatB, partial [Gammaproteobacteria bacterium]|nr:Asp-tRNA(Asn)/Glu-tRNA(Gln) amidotransferase subunit GatB [Gammaproteobacteria bacterium]